MPTSPPDRRSALAVLLTAVLALSVAGSASAQPALVAVAGVPVDGQARLTVTVPESAAGSPAPDSFAVTVDGVTRPARAEPLLSDRLALGLVVDGSTAAREALPSGLSGAADLLLTIPPTIRSALVVDGSPPRVGTPLQPGPAAALAALSQVISGGAAHPADALDLMLDQLPETPTEPRVVVLYTTAGDAAGVPATELVQRLNAAGVVLVVVCVDAGGPAGPQYWSTVSAGTGGFALHAATTQVVAAFDRVATDLDRRYLVTFPAPDRLPAAATVSVGAGDGRLDATTTVPAPPTPTALVVALAVAAIALALVVLVGAVIGLRLLLRRRTRRPAAPAPVSADAPASEPDPARRARTWNVPARPDAPIGRDRHLAALHDALRPDAPVALRPADGRPGAGGSTMMIEYAHRYGQAYDIAWWIPAALPELVPHRLAELAELLGLADQADPVDRAAARLGAALRDRDDWLILLDDADDPQPWLAQLPTGPGRLLVTSADPEWGALGTQLTVPALTRADAVALVRARCPKLPVDAAALLATALDDQPLALDVAAATLAATGLGVEALLARLAAADPERSAPASAAWAVALDVLATDDPAALDLLTVVAWLGPDPVPLSLIGGAAAALPEPLATAARAPAGLAGPADTLCRRGLARVDGETVQVHRLGVQVVLARGPTDGRPETASASTAPDSAAPDSAAPDSAAPDSAAPDSAAPDSAAPDSAAPDSADPDSAAGTEFSGPDSAGPDSADSSGPNSSALASAATEPAGDSAAADSAAADSAAADSAAADSVAADSVAADSVAADSAAAGSVAADSAAPEPAAPDRATPDRAAPEPGGWPAIAVRVLRAGLPAEPSREPRTWSAWRRLLPLVLTATDPSRRLDAVASEVSSLLAQAGGYLDARGQAGAARGLVEDARELSQHPFGPDHPDTLAAARLDSESDAAAEPQTGAPRTTEPREAEPREAEPQTADRPAGPTGY